MDGKIISVLAVVVAITIIIISVLPKTVRDVLISSFWSQSLVPSLSLMAIPHSA
jgi:hypothetical protein